MPADLNGQVAKIVWTLVQSLATANYQIDLLNETIVAKEAEIAALKAKDQPPA